MKKYILLSLLIITQACLSISEPTVLDGVWRSDAEMTLQNITEKNSIPKERMDFLREHLGELRLQFNGNKSRVLFSDTIEEDDIEWKKFKVLNIDDKSITIKVKDIRTPETTYYFSGKCFYLIQESWGYKEYFCKVKGT